MDEKKVLKILENLDIDSATKEKLLARVKQEGYTQDVIDEVMQVLDGERDKVTQEINEAYEDRSAELEGVKLTKEEQAELKKIQDEYKGEVKDAVDEYKKEMDDMNKKLDEDAKGIENDQKKN